MRPYAETTHADLFPGDGAERDRWIELASPIRHVSRTSPPHVLVHGDRDDIIPVEHSYRYEQALRAAGVECTTAILPGVGHSGRILYGSEEVKALVAAFFERWLR
jgi:dipeptidyl aminopeptidase/acylaminoacyl peptidase